MAGELAKVTWQQLLYPLGLVALPLFFLRFLFQWIASERAGKSVVPELFWQLSLVAHLLMVVHSTIQFQYHVGVVQLASGLIAYRNLELRRRHPCTSSTFCCLFALLLALFTIGFALLAQLCDASWWSVPMNPWRERPVDCPWQWHLFGLLGMALFSSRFWIQWWHAERHKWAELPPLFWWMSFIGNGLMLFYFGAIGDLVNGAGPLIALIPYGRNLQFAMRRSAAPEAPFGLRN